VKDPAISLVLSPWSEWTCLLQRWTDSSPGQADRPERRLFPALLREHEHRRLSWERVQFLHRGREVRLLDAS